MKTFEEIREEWCKNQGFESFLDYSNSLSISDGEYEALAEIYADQFRKKIIGYD